MIAAEGKHAETAQKIKITRALPVIEIRSLTSAEPDIVSDGFEHSHHLIAQMAAVHRVSVGLVAREKRGHIDANVRQCPLPVGNGTGVQWSRTALFGCYVVHRRPRRLRSLAL